jgi:hypothetical protein
MQILGYLILHDALQNAYLTAIRGFITIFNGKSHLIDIATTKAQNFNRINAIQLRHSK